MPKSKSQRPELTATMRDFRAAPAKLLRRAARTGSPIRLGEFVIEVREEHPELRDAPALYGSMAPTGRLVGDAAGLLSTDDTWTTEVGQSDE